VDLRQTPRQPRIGRMAHPSVGTIHKADAPSFARFSRRVGGSDRATEPAPARKACSKPNSLSALIRPEAAQARIHKGNSSDVSGHSGQGCHDTEPVSLLQTRRRLCHATFRKSVEALNAPLTPAIITNHPYHTSQTSTAPGCDHASWFGAAWKCACFLDGSLQQLPNASPFSACRACRVPFGWTGDLPEGTDQGKP
jgi:hypothetical protein